MFGPVHNCPEPSCAVNHYVRFGTQMTTTPKKRGRPRAFDADFVMERATETFLRHGLSGASLDALTASMELSKPSLYGAFGDKRQLFQKVVEARALAVGKRIRAAFERGDSLHGAIRSMLEEAAVIYTDDAMPSGCLIVSACATEALVDEDLARYAREFFARSDHAIGRWLDEKHGVRGPLSAHAIGRMVNGVIHDIALRARVGESRATLKSYAREAAEALAPP